MFKNIALLFFIPYLSISQNLYNPQELYDLPGGIFEEDSLRVLNLQFYNTNYHNYLVNSWFYSPSERIPASLTVNNICVSVTAISKKSVFRN